MAIGKHSDFKVYEEELQGGITEKLQQNADVFNEGSRGAIRVVAMDKTGNYEKEAFYKSLSGLVARQDITSTSGVTSTALTQDESIRVKVHRRVGPIENTKKSFKMIGKDSREFSFVLGEQLGQAMAENMLNTGLNAAAAALANQSAVKRDITAATVKTANHTDLVKTLGLFGDKANRIAAWVMHSTQFFDLGVQAIADQIDTIASDVIQVFSIPGLGRPIVVTDSASLIVTGDTPDSYYVLGLAADGVQLVESEALDLEVETVTGLEQLTVRYQGEFAFNVGVKGFQWDTSNGGANPADATIGTGSNWDKVATSNKDLAGVVLKCQALADQS